MANPLDSLRKAADQRAKLIRKAERIAGNITKQVEAARAAGTQSSGNSEASGNRKG